MSDPDEITIIVHSAKGLQGKKSGRHKFSVIFGLGGTKFRTAIVKEPSGNPEWNEETVVQVTNILDQVFFIVTEKDDILGQLSIPVTSLRATKGQAKRVPLQPHKRCPKPQGELLYQCFVSKYHNPGEHVPVIRNVNQTPDHVRPISAFQRLKKRMASPVTQRKLKRDDSGKDKDRRNSSLSGFNKRLSRSIQDLFTFNKLSGVDSGDIDDTTSNSSFGSKKNKGKRKFSLSFLSVSNNLDQAGEDPVIISCTPNSGPIDRPTRLTIEGRNLGIGKSDIMSLKIVGCDCTDTLEYESSNRIYCTTHFWKVGKGAVVIDTISGGIGTLKEGFTFYEELDANENTSKNPFDGEGNEEQETLGEQNVGFSIGGKEIKSGSNTLPRIKASAILPDKGPTTSTPTLQGRYQKKHARHASESVVSNSNQPPVEHVSKEQLQQRIAELEDENAALKKDNVEMKGYIDKLVAKCMIHCPEALAQEDGEKAKLYVL